MQEQLNTYRLFLTSRTIFELTSRISSSQAGGPGGERWRMQRCREMHSTVDTLAPRYVSGSHCSTCGRWGRAEVCLSRSTAAQSSGVKV